jgi:membrane protease YdiL (CAAX protease family)
VGEDAEVKVYIDGWLLLYKKHVTLLILCVLLLLRFFSGYLSNFQGGYQAFYYILFTFPFLVIVIWLNKDDPQSLHIDKPFILIFLLLGILLTLTFWPSILGVISGAGTVFVLSFFIKQEFRFDKGATKSVFVTTMIGLIPVVLLRMSIHGSFSANQILESNNYDLGWIFASRLWGVVYEEMLFRGLLWMALTGLKFEDKTILLVQAFLFWVAHINRLPALSFWTTIPLSGLWFGFLVLRSKSLTPSTVTHFVYNFTAALIALNL